jgi:ATP-dependent Clp protease ATP-binding subunit ClpC
VTVEEVRRSVARIVGQGDEVARGQMPFTPRAKKVLELSLREAMSLGHKYIGTEHILLGIVRENEGVAIQILRELGAADENVRRTVAGLLGGSAYRPTPMPRERRRRLSPFVVGWALGAVTLGAGILIGWGVWG